MAGAPIAILRTGLVTPAGLGSAQTWTSVRAGLAAFGETSVLDKSFDPFVMALVPEDDVPPGLELPEGAEATLTSRQARMLRLGGLALQEVLDGQEATEKVPVYLAGPEPMGERPAPVETPFLEYLSVQSETPIDVDSSRVFPSGRAGGLLALEAALSLIRSGKAERVVVGGVDTYLDLYLLGTMDRDRRIASSTCMDGLIPGEAAAFVLLGKATDGAANLPTIPAVSTAEEPGHLGSDEPYKGEGLAEAFTALFTEHPPTTPVSTLFADFTGEGFRAKEWGVAYLRNSEHIQPEVVAEHPADCFGDTGAAAGPLLLALASLGLQQGSVQGPCVVSCSSDGAPRAVALLEVPPKQGD
jgi:3-oxoacyl-[acyl-carrier-protein] synthase-1